jgi:hypothetical protein
MPIKSPIADYSSECRAIVKSGGIEIEIYAGISMEILQGIIKSVKES